MSEPCRVITEEQWKDYLRSKEQLKEANEIIKEVSTQEAFFDWDENAWELCTKYLEKWGVK